MPADQERGSAEQPLLANENADYGASTHAGQHPSGADPSPTLPAGSSFRRNLGTLEAFAIVVSIVIGSGVFTSPGSIDANVPSPGAALAVWLVGGLLAWTGASALTELGTAIPGEGGVQPYLQYIFGDVFGFLAAWTWVVAVMPATLAILSIVFVESMYSATGVTDEADRLSHKLLSVLVLVAVTAANSISTRASTRLNNFFVATKFTSIALVVAAGLLVAVLVASDPGRWQDAIGGRDWHERPWFRNRDTPMPGGGTIHWDGLSTWEILGNLSAALYGALWAYSGWDKAVYITAELSAPARQLPLAINSAVPTIVLCFVATNAAYYVLLPWNVVSTTDSVAVTAITRLLGPLGGVVAATLICLVVAGSLLGNSFIASRMAVAASNKGWLPRIVGVLGHFGLPSAAHSGDTTTPDAPSPPPETPESDAPINALLLGTALSTLYILLGSFRALLTFNGLGEYSFFFVTVCGAIFLRFREPSLPRPYRPLLIVPVAFAVVSGFVVARGAVFAPIQAAILVALWIIGILYYLARQAWAQQRDD